MVSVGTPCNVYVSILFLKSPYYRLQLSKYNRNDALGIYYFFKSAYPHRPVILLRSFLFEYGILLDAYNCIIYIYEVDFYIFLSLLLLEGY